MNQLATRLESPYELIVQSGPDKGAIFKLSLGQVTIGRDPENDIIFSQDPKISRNQAVLDVRPNVVEIVDVSQKNKLFINDKCVPRAQLVKGTKIQLGDTILLFNAYTETIEPSLISTQLYPVTSHSPEKLKTSRHKSKTPKRNINYIWIVLLIIGGLFFLQTKPKNSTEEIIRDSTEYNEALTERQKQIDEIEQSLLKKKQNTPGYADAQVNFVKGFRDYQKGQYDHAMNSFNACSRVLPQCERYLGLSKKKLGDLIQSEMNYGRKYLDQGLYQPCMATFKNVMFLIKDKTSSTYKEAEQNHLYCASKKAVRL